MAMCFVILGLSKNQRKYDHLITISFYASGDNAYEMLQEERDNVKKISALDMSAHLRTANFFKFYSVMLWSEFL